MPLDTADKDWLKALAEDVARRTVYAVMTGGVGQWSNPDRPGWEWYTPDVQASALDSIRRAGTVPGTTDPEQAYDLLFDRVRNIENDVQAIKAELLPTPFEPPPIP